MYRISFFALAVAFLAELGVDILNTQIVAFILADDVLSADMSEDAARQALEAVTKSPAFLTIGLILGTATTVGGGYLAARLARRYPYYHGLAMGLLGIAFTLYMWREQPLWLGLFAIATNIPLCIWGAHLAKRNMPAPE